MDKQKKTYQQDWPTYYAATRKEKLMFFRLLRDAVDHLNIEQPYRGNGRPEVSFEDILKCLCIKSYSNYSSWRSESELRIARAMGIIRDVYKRSTLLKYLQDRRITVLLHRLYQAVAEPLSSVEMYFCADATGISNRYGNSSWRRVRTNRKEWRHYSKLHVISGVQTNIICAAKITEGKTHESPLFKPLLDDTARIFNIKELSADAGYLSRNNVKAISSIGAKPFIKGKKTVDVPKRGPYSPWRKMLHDWKYNQPYFYDHYHRRSNVESTFGALKRKFGDFCRCKKLSSQENEILCRIVCFNISVLAEALLSHDLRSGFIDG